MRDNFTRTLDKLKTNYDRDTTDAIKNKQRMLENMEINMDRLKYTQKQALNSAKSQTL